MVNFDVVCNAEIVILKSNERAFCTEFMKMLNIIKFNSSLTKFNA